MDPLMLYEAYKTMISHFIKPICTGTILIRYFKLLNNSDFDIEGHGDLD